MRRLFKFRYPKIVALIILIIIAYFIFRNSYVRGFVSSLGQLSYLYLGVFIAGMLFSFGFTAPFSVGFFIVSNPPNIWLAGAVGGLGALVSDLIIFKFIRFSFMDEFKRLEKTKIFEEINNVIEKNFGHRIKVYLMYVFIGILIASPLPDEAGVIMLAALTKIKITIFLVLSLTLNTIGILIFLSL